MTEDEELSLGFPSEVGAPWLSETASYLRGWPGCRARPGRSGLDPLDTEFGLAHMQGVFLRALVTGRLRTREPAYLLLMALVGVVAVAPGAAALLLLPSSGGLALAVSCALAPYTLLGTGLLWNLALSLRRGPVGSGRSA